MKTIRIATRKSPLALWQANWVKDQLESSGLSAELVGVETKGDQILNSAIAEIGSKGVFTEELEELLSKGEVDIAVHSAKDLPSDLPEGFEIISIGPRHEINDVLVSQDSINLEETLTIGTSSTRRIAQLGCFFPHLKTVPVRGNLQTRIRKMNEGDCDALLLAKAGVERMGYQHLVRHEFATDRLTPAAGQGSIAIEAHESIHPTIRKLIKAATNDEDAWRAISCERSFLKILGGGCSIPVFAHAVAEGGGLRLSAGILSLDGSEHVSCVESGNESMELGQKTAAKVISDGGGEILAEIKKQLGYL